MKNGVLTKKDIFILILMVFTGVGITIAGIKFDPTFVQSIPLYVSLIIAFLQSRVNRYSSLLGCINSIFYAIVYFKFGIYGSAASALLFSCPIQLITFIRWNKHKRGESTKLKKLTGKQRLLTFAIFTVLVVAMWIILPLLGSDYVFLDSLSTLLGILIYFLTMFAYIEYTVCMMANGMLTIALYLTMIKDSPAISTHLIFAVYSFICITFAFFEARKLYKKQTSNV